MKTKYRVYYNGEDGKFYIQYKLFGLFWINYSDVFNDSLSFEFKEDAIEWIKNTRIIETEKKSRKKIQKENSKKSGVVYED